MKEHHKHPPLKRPAKGIYHPCEWAIYGTSCGNITKLFESIQENVDFRWLYVDADHSDDAKDTQLIFGKKQFTIAEVLPWNEYDDRIIDLAIDAMIVNGNHYPAEKQIVVIDPVKKDSLLRRVDQLTDIDIVIADSKDEIFDFVLDKMTEQTKLISRNDLNSLYQHLLEKVKLATAPLKTLILAGGKSSRMNSDKSTLSYHDGKSQQEYLAQLCADQGLEVYISKAYDYPDANIGKFAVLKDRMIDMGPFGAIVSAMMHDPDAAWLVLACDLPFIHSDTIKRLIDERNNSLYATAFRVDDEPFPQPLMAIYEPRIYQRMLRFLSQGYACPRKVLINSEIEILSLEDKLQAYNANTAEEREFAINKLADE